MGVIVRGTVAEGELFRGNCQGGQKSKVRGLIVLGGFYRGQLFWGELSKGNGLGIKVLRGISWGRGQLSGG